MNTEQERAELLPCPFCGGTNIEIQISTPDREGVPTNLMCSDCGASGPWEYEQGNSHAKADDAWNRRADLQSQKYTSAIGEAGQAYLDQFKNAHALPAEFRWSELWAVMCVAANKVRPDALQSQDREDAERYRWLRQQRSITDFACVTWNIGHDWVQMDGAELDAAIDRARRIEEEA